MTARSGRACQFPPTLLNDPCPVAECDLVLRPALHRRPVSLQREQVVANSGNLLDQVLAGRIVPAVNGVRVVGHGGIRGRGYEWRRLGSLAAEPRSPRPENLGDIRAEYRGGNWPNTRNPAGDTGGVGLAVSGGIAAKLREWDSGDRGGRAVHLANHLVAPRSRKVQPPRGCLSACSREVANGLYFAAMPRRPKDTPAKLAPPDEAPQGPAARCANVAVELARLKGAIMKTLVGALTVGAILIGASSLSWAADVRHMRQPKHDDPERLRMIRECMDMHGKHRGDMPFHSGGNERLYHACMANHSQATIAGWDPNILPHPPGALRS